MKGAIPTDEFHEITTRHTEDMQEIITKIPSWMLRWGIMLFFGILLMLFGISNFIKYPDVIRNRMRLQSSGISTTVTASASGKIIKMLVRKDALVKKEQPLMYIKNVIDQDKITIIKAPRPGRISIISISQTGYVVKSGQELFRIRPLNEHFFGVIQLRQENIDKVKVGQPILINLKNYPVEEYGQMTGKITYITDEPNNNGFFLLGVAINTLKLKKAIELKDWMIADAAIVTRDMTLLNRITDNIFKQ